MSKTTSQDIKATLWKAAGTFRGTIDAANYKDFVLSMLFLKYLWCRLYLVETDLVTLIEMYDWIF